MNLNILTQNWDYPKDKAVCFTGHRPEKISGYNGNGKKPPDDIKNFLTYQIEKAVNDGFLVFYNGLAKGVDLWAGEIVLDLKKKYPEISLIGIQPFPDHGKHFAGCYGKSFKKVYDEADLILCTSDVYHKGTFLIRDRFMADHSSRLIGVCDMNDKKSGTYYTIDYAEKTGLDCIVMEL